ncbi:TPA: hypothetical protein ACPVXB_005068 [Vibrio parahaemolyticus]
MEPTTDRVGMMFSVESSNPASIINTLTGFLIAISANWNDNLTLKNYTITFFHPSSETSSSALTTKVKSLESAGHKVLNARFSTSGRQGEIPLDKTTHKNPWEFTCTAYSALSNITYFHVESVNVIRGEKDVIRGYTYSGSHTMNNVNLASILLYIKTLEGNKIYVTNFYR